MSRTPFTDEQKALKRKMTIEALISDIKIIKRAADIVNKGKLSSFLIKIGVDTSIPILQKSGFSCNCGICPFCEEMKKDGEILKREEREDL